MISREKELVVRRMEDSIKFDEVSRKVTASYPWTEDITKLVDNLSQAKRTQRGVERRLLKDPTCLSLTILSSKNL